jgi:hypothetical protein
VSVPDTWPQVLDFFGSPLVIEPSSGQLSSDAGLLPIRQFDDRIGLTRAFTDALDDPRDPDLTEHTFLEMVRFRVYGILAGYEDQNDHDPLHADPRLQTPRRPLPPTKTTWPASRRYPASSPVPVLAPPADLLHNPSPRLPRVGVGGRWAHGGDHGRSAPTHGLEAHGSQPRGDGLESSGLCPVIARCSLPP